MKCKRCKGNGSFSIFKENRTCNVCKGSGNMNTFEKCRVVTSALFMIGAIIGIGLIAGGEKSLKSEVPFGPFIVGGTFAAMFLGEMITGWYFQYFILM